MSVDTLRVLPQDSKWVEEKQLLLRTNQDLLEKVRDPCSGALGPPASPAALEVLPCGLS